MHYVRLVNRGISRCGARGWLLTDKFLGAGIIHTTFICVIGCIAGIHTTADRVTGIVGAIIVIITNKGCTFTTVTEVVYTVTVIHGTGIVIIAIDRVCAFPIRGPRNITASIHRSTRSCYQSDYTAGVRETVIYEFFNANSCEGI